MTQGPKEMTALAAEAISGVRIMDNAGAFKVYEGEPWLDRIRNIDLDALLAAAAPASGAEQMRGLSASEFACYEWPDHSDEHKACRAAYVQGAMSVTAPPAAGLDRKAVIDNIMGELDRAADNAVIAWNTVQKLRPYIERAILAPPVPGLDREGLIQIIMRETTDRITSDGLDTGHRPNALVQGCKFMMRQHWTSSTDGYENPETAALRFAGFIADAVILALQAAPSTKIDGER